MMKFTAAEKAAISTVWALRDLGNHAWIPRAKGFLTLEPIAEDGEDLILAVYCDNVDDLGFPAGSHVYNTAILDRLDVLRITTGKRRLTK